MEKFSVFNLYLLGAHMAQCLMQYDADLFCCSVVSPTLDGAVCSCLTSCSAAGRSVLVKQKPANYTIHKINFLASGPIDWVSADKTANTDTKPGSPLYTMPQMLNKILPSSLSLGYNRLKCRVWANVQDSDMRDHHRALTSPPSTTPKNHQTKQRTCFRITEFQIQTN
jgi:hypothetical protein